MKAWRRTISVGICASIFAFLPITSQSEELLGLLGVTDTDDNTGATYGWQIEINKPLSSRFTASLGWINEGHLQGHHRDGAVAQLWIKGFQWCERLTLDFGIGPYFYFDTQPSSSQRGYNDFHGVAPVVSASLSMRINNAWSLYLNANGTHTPGHSSTRAALFGASYHFGDLSHDLVRLTAGVKSISEHDEEIQFFGGKVISNSLDARETQAVGVDYRYEYVSWSAWSLTWFYNPSGQNGQHNRIATQLWLVDHFKKQRFSFSAGLGAYVRLGSRHFNSANTPQTVNGLFSLRAEWQWTSRVSTIFSGYRLFTQDDRDRDILTLGLGWRFGRTTPLMLNN